MVKNPHYRRTGSDRAGGAICRLARSRWYRAAGRPSSAGALGQRFRRLRLLVVGAGDIGGRVIAMLAQRFAGRIALIATTRSTEQRGKLRQHGARTLALDLDQPRSAQRVGAFGCWLINLTPPLASGDDDPRSKHLIAALARGAARQLAVGAFIQTRIYASTTGVYGDSAGAQFDETRATNPQSDRAARRLAAETRWRQASCTTARARTRTSPSASARTVIIRVPGIYGSDRLPLERLQRGLPVLLPELDVYTNHIHADDLARIVWLALFRGRSNRIYHAVDNSDLKMGDYFDAVADAVGLARPPRLDRDQLKGQVSPAMWSFMQESRRLLNHRLRQELRIRLRYPTVADALECAAHVPV